MNGLRNDAGLSTIYGMCRASGGSASRLGTSLENVLRDGGVVVSAQDIVRISRIAAETWQSSGGSRTTFAARLKERLGEVAGGRKFLAAMTLACALQGVTMPWGAMAEVAPGSGNSGEDILVGGSGSVDISTGLTLSAGSSATMGIYALGSAVSTLVSSTGSMYVYDSGTAIETTIFDGGEAHVSYGGLAVGTTLSGTLHVSSGGSATGTTINGGVEHVHSGGGASGTLVNAGAMHVSAGGSAIDTTLSGGEQTVSGVALSTTVSSGGLQTIFASGTAIDTTVAGGEQQVLGVASATTVSAGGSQAVQSGASAIDTTLTNGEQEVFGVASATTVSAGGSQIIHASGTAIDTTLMASGEQHVFGFALSTTVSSGGTQNVYSGGSATDTAVSAGGAQVVDADGSAIDTTLEGGDQYVSSGGLATSTTVNAQGAQHVYGDGSALDTVLNTSGHQYISGGLATSTTVNADGMQFILEGRSARDTVVVSGNQIVSSGTATSTILDAGGGQTIFAGGEAAETLVSGDGALQTLSGGQATFTQVSAGGSQHVLGGLAMSTTLGAGGTQTVEGGLASATIVNADGEQNLLSGGVASGTTVNSGGAQNIFTGGSSIEVTQSWGGNVNVTVAGNDSATYVTGLNASGQSFTLANGSASNFQIFDEGVQAVEAGGIAMSTTVFEGGAQDVLSGGSSIDVVQSSGGNVNVIVAGGDSATYVSGLNAAGQTFTLANGSASNFQIFDGGVQTVEAGGIAMSTTVFEGGTQDIRSGGSSIDVVQSAGGNINAVVAGDDSATYISGTNAFGDTLTLSGGVASNFVIYDGGLQMVSAGGAAHYTHLLAGASQTVTGTGTQAISTQVSAGATQRVLDSAMALDAMVAGLQSLEGGSASGTKLLQSGHQLVLENGRAIETSVSDGASMTVSAGGVAESAHIFAGGIQTLNSGGFAIGMDVLSGGTLDVSGGSVGGNIELHDGAILAGSSVEMAGDSASLTFEVASDPGRTVSASIQGSGTVVKTGTGLLQLAGDNIYTGGAVISAGTLAGNIVSGADLTVASGAVYAGSGTDGVASARTVGILQGAGTIKYTSGLEIAEGVFEGGIDGTNTGTVTKVGSGVFILNGTGNVYSGTTVVAGGVLAGNIPQGGELFISSGGTYDAAFYADRAAYDAGSGITTSRTVGTLNGVAGATITNATDFTVTAGSFGGVFVGSATNLVKVGSGTTLTLTGANAFTGESLEIRAGTVQVTGAGTIAPARLAMTGGAALNVSGATAYAGSGAMAVREVYVSGTDAGPVSMIGNFAIGGTAADPGFINFSVPDGTGDGATFIALNGNVTVANATIYLTFPSDTIGLVNDGDKFVLIDVQGMGSGTYDLASLTLSTSVASGGTFTLASEGGDLVAIYNSGGSSGYVPGQPLVISSGETSTFGNGTVSGGAVSIESGEYGPLTINAGGVLQLTQDLGLDGSALSFGNGLLQANRNMHVGADVTLNSGTVRAVGLGGAAVLDGGTLRNNAILELGDTDLAASGSALGGTVAMNVSNNGSMRVLAGTWTFAPGTSLSNLTSGTLAVGGTLDLRNATLSNAGLVAVQGGTLSVTGDQVLALMGREPGNAAPDAEKGHATVSGGRIDVQGSATLNTAWITGMSAGTGSRGTIALGNDGILRVNGDLALSGARLDVGSSVTGAALQVKGTLTLAEALTLGGNTTLGVAGKGVSLTGATLTVGDAAGTPQLVLGEEENDYGTIDTNIAVGSGHGIFSVAAGSWTLADGHSVSVNGPDARLEVGTSGGARPARLDIATGASLVETQDDLINVLNHGTLSMDRQTAEGISGTVHLENGGTMRVTSVGEMTASAFKEFKAETVTGDGIFSTDVVLTELKDIASAGSAGYDELFGSGGLLSDIGNVTTDQTAEVALSGVKNDGADGGTKANGIFAAVDMADGQANQINLTSGYLALTGGSAGGAVVTSAGVAGGLAIGDEAAFGLGYKAIDTDDSIEVAYVAFQGAIGHEGGTLNVTEDTIVHGDISGSAGGKGFVYVEDAVLTVSGAIGGTGTPVSYLGGTSGGLSAQSVNANAIDLLDMNTFVTGSVTATSAANISGGIFEAGRLSAESLNVNNASATIKGEVDVTSDVRINGGSFNAGSLTTRTNLAANDANTVISNTVTITGDANITGGSFSAGALWAANLTATSATAAISGHVNVGGDVDVTSGVFSAGSLTAGNLALTQTTANVSGAVAVNEAVITGGSFNAASLTAASLLAQDAVTSIGGAVAITEDIGITGGTFAAESLTGNVLYLDGAAATFTSAVAIAEDVVLLDGSLKAGSLSTASLDMLGADADIAGNVAVTSDVTVVSGSLAAGSLNTTNVVLNNATANIAGLADVTSGITVIDGAFAAGSLNTQSVTLNDGNMSVTGAVNVTSGPVSVMGGSLSAGSLTASSFVTSAADTDIAGALNITGGPVEVTGGTLGAGSITAASFAATSADTVVSNAIVAGTVDISGGTLAAGSITTYSLVQSGGVTNITGVVTVDGGAVTVSGGSLGAGPISAASLSLTGASANVKGAVDVTNDIVANGGGFVAESLNAANLTLTATSTVVSGLVDVSSGTTNLSSGTFKAGSLITQSFTAKGTTTSIGGLANVTDGDVTVSGGSFKAGSLTAANLALSGASATITSAADLGEGTVTVSGGSLNVGTLTADSIDTSRAAISAGTINIGDTGATFTAGSLKAKSIVLEGDMSLANGIDATIGDLAANGNDVSIGQDGDTAGVALRIGSLALEDGILLVDPPWTSGPTKVAIAGASTNGTPVAADIVNIDGDVGIGRNSYLAFGTADENWLVNATLKGTNNVGLSQYGVTAAMGVYNKIRVGTPNGEAQAIVVDGSRYNGEGGDLQTYTEERPGNSITFADNSLLAVNADAANGSPAITILALAGGDSPSVYLGDNAKLVITGLDATSSTTCRSSAAPTRAVTPRAPSSTSASPTAP
ncbi:MAG: AIDA repeat-containing protein [Desulfovibrio sp.]|jgi:autotransporter passenger strand-loop-strand repeat protein/autotransporter-associated beta strand protein|nr:AIDA repeat-containing protein [Desulfovibrio sp.]